MSRDLISGGASVATKERLVVVRTEDGQRVEQTALLKRTSAAEVSALRAATQVPGASAIPEIVDAGVDVDGCWLLIPFYDGGPAEAEIRIPGNVVESLARMHAYYLDSPVPEHIPVVDQSWWQARCAQSVERLTALGRPATRAIAARVETWAHEISILAELEQLPRTLLHGDMHRHNVLVDQAGAGHLIDWGAAAFGLPAFDLVRGLLATGEPALGSPGSQTYQVYADTWTALTGQSLTSPGWRRGYLVATVCNSARFIGLAAKLYSEHRAQAMLREGADALLQLRTESGS